MVRMLCVFKPNKTCQDLYKGFLTREFNDGLFLAGWKTIGPNPIHIEVNN